MQNFIELLKIPFFIFISSYIVLITLLYIFQSKLIYFPTKNVDITPKAINLEYESIIFEADDKTKLHAWYIPKKMQKPHYFFSMVMVEICLIVLIQ